MKKPLTGVPLTIFMMWFYSPLLVLAYLDFLSILSFQKMGCILIFVVLATSAFIASLVMFSEEFQQFSRATPFRILVFYGIAFAVAEVFVVVLSAIQEDLRVTMRLITIPAIYSFFFTPLLVMRYEVLLPKPDDPSHS
ncbi:MAG: hypothetical protein WCG75_05700 [Armatimonadota bacterium]